MLKEIIHKYKLMIFMNMRDNPIPIGVSLPKRVVNQIDTERKDVSRSRFLLRLIERAYSAEHKVDMMKKP
jgi:hypothetical protein